MEVSANLGGGTTVGCGPNYLVGGAEIHFSPKIWYINIGRADALRTPLKLGIGFPGGTTAADGTSTAADPCAGKLKISAYFSIGNSIPPMQPLPNWAAELLNDGLSTPDQSTRENGRGFAFGAAIDFGFKKAIGKTNDKGVVTKGVYADVTFTFGFDMMMLDYGGTTCANYNNEQIGMNGWYASGQAYAKLQGDIGVIFRSKSYPIMSAGVAMVMQAQGPKPFWAKGAAQVEYSILGGIFKGQKKMKFEIGKKCEKISPGNNSDEDKDDLENEMIVSISPDNDATDVSLQAQPEVLFSVPLGKPIVGTDLDDNDVTTKFEIITKEPKFLLTRKDNSTIDNVTWFYNKEQTRAYMSSAKQLPHNEKLTLKVTVETIKKVFEEDGKTLINEISYPAEKTVTFTTEDIMRYIPEANIISSYPINGQSNFYTEENTQRTGFIQLEREQDILLKTGIASGSSLGVRIYESGPTKTKIAQIPCTYDQASSRINFTFPNSILQPNKLYKMAFGVFPSCDDEVDAATCKEKSEIVYTMYFRTSKYPTFLAKMKAATFESVATDQPDFYSIKINTDETLDRFELGYVPGKFPMVIIKDETLTETIPYWKSLIDNFYAKLFPSGNNYYIEEGYSVSLADNKTKVSLPEQLLTVVYQNVGSEFPLISAATFESGTVPVANDPQVIPYYKYNFIQKEREAINKQLDVDAKNYDEYAAFLIANGSSSFTNKPAQLKDFTDKAAAFKAKIPAIPALPAKFKMTFYYKLPPAVKVKGTNVGNAGNFVLKPAGTRSVVIPTPIILPQIEKLNTFDNWLNFGAAQQTSIFPLEINKP